MSLNVFHISEFGLPDWRIEKSANAANRIGQDVFFMREESSDKPSSYFYKIVFITASIVTTLLNFVEEKPLAEILDILDNKYRKIKFQEQEMKS